MYLNFTVKFCYAVAGQFLQIPSIVVHNTCEYWANTWKLCSPASEILASIVTILVSFEVILKKFSVIIKFKSQFQYNDLPQALKCIKIASKLTSIVTILAGISLAGEHIIQVLAQYL